MSAQDSPRPAPTPFHEAAGEGLTVRGMLHVPAGRTEDGLVLTHGAGSSSDSPLLVALAEALAARGVVVLRCDLPFRLARPHGSPSPAGAARDRAGLRAAVAALVRTGLRRVGLGGHSYGGRQASLLAAEEPTLASALLLLAYPLHPPGRLGELRIAHFPRLRTPALFVHGTTDPFGSVAEIRSALAGIPAPTALHLEPGVGHDLGASRRSRNTLSELAARIAERWLEVEA
ncbi:MAG TPA: alpha/beta fold hydrolase [Vicinamibacteria bacterium]|nr:alpha/beta fold hydrolase [Vicinamibacteria bacterium]